VPSERRGAGQIHDRIRDLLDQGRPTLRQQALITSVGVFRWSGV
jgi:hypothetical protein